MDPKSPFYNMIKQIYILISLLVLLNSCNNHIVFQDYQAIANEKWDRTQQPAFQVVIPTKDYYTLSVAIRHTSNYPMSNLWCFVDIYHHNQLLKRDTCNLKIAEYNGRWMGDGGAIKTVVQKIDSNAIFLPADTLTIRVQQAMRESVLDGIRDIGIELNKLKK